MAGPTPVSALIHAATMVTAGIYMITRSHALFALAPYTQNIVALVGAATALWAGLIAIGQFDIKRVLAYSTISQLGFMVAAVGLGGYVAGMFHLVTHAFFKALLFLSSGSVIQAVERGEHAMHEAAHPAERGASGAHGGGGHEEHAAAPHTAAPAHAGAPAFDPQDMRNMGGLWTRLPVTKWVYLIGALTLAGLPPFAGFFSKDEILLDALDKNPLVFGLLLTAAFCTAFYMGRQILMVFFGRGRSEAAKHATESPAVVTVPLIILAVLSVFGGGLNLPGLHTLGDWLGHTLGEHEAGAFNIVLAAGATGLALIAIALSYALYRLKPATAEERDPLQGLLGPLFGWLNRKLYVDEVYDFLILRPYGWLARFTAEVIDWRFWHDWFHDRVVAGLFNTFARLTAEGLDLGGVDQLISAVPAALSRALARLFSRLETGYVRNYALAVFFGVVLVMGYLLISANLLVK
jgi:NADH-quinone oxidoreductase subunit L